MEEDALLMPVSNVRPVFSMVKFNMKMSSANQKVNVLTI